MRKSLLNVIVILILLLIIEIIDTKNLKKSVKSSLATSLKKSTKENLNLMDFTSGMANKSGKSKTKSQTNRIATIDRVSYRVITRVPLR